MPQSAALVCAGLDNMHPDKQNQPLPMQSLLHAFFFFVHPLMLPIVSDCVQLLLCA